jgi:O-antigen/teichoic acid export membrane protein
VTLDESAFPVPGVDRTTEARFGVEKSSTLLAGSLLAMATQGVSSLAIALALTPSERGNFTLAVNVPILVVVLVSGGLLYSVPYLVRRRGLPPAAMGIGFAAAVAASGLVGCVVAGVFWFHPANLFRGADHLTALIALGAAVLAGAYSYSAATALGFDAVRQYLIGILSQPLLLIALLAALIVLQGGLTANSSAAAWLASMLVVAVYSTLVLRRIASAHDARAKKVHRRGRVLSELLRYSARTQATVSLQQVAFRSDLIVVAAFLSSYQLGLYAIAVFVAEISWMPATAASQALFADLLGTASTKRTLHGIQNSFAVTIACGAAVLAGSVLLFAKILSQYEAALPATTILIPGLVLGSISRPYSAHLMAMGRAGDAARFSAVGAVAALVLYPVATITLGIIGAATATTAIYALQALIATVALRRERPADWASIFRLDHGYTDVVRAASARIRRTGGNSRTGVPRHGDPASCRSGRWDAQDT